MTSFLGSNSVQIIVFPSANTEPQEFGCYLPCTGHAHVTTPVADRRHHSARSGAGFTWLSAMLRVRPERAGTDGLKQEHPLPWPALCSDDHTLRDSRVVQAATRPAVFDQIMATRVSADPNRFEDSREALDPIHVSVGMETSWDVESAIRGSSAVDVGTVSVGRWWALEQTQGYPSTGWLGGDGCSYAGVRAPARERVPTGTATWPPS